MKSLILADKTGQNLAKKEKLMYGLIALFFITIYLPTMPVINNIFIGLIFVYSFFYNSVSDKIRLLKQRKAMMLMILFYILHLVSAVISANKSEAVTMLGLRVPLIMFPIAVGLIYIKKELKERILLCYCFTATVAAVICLGNAIVNALKFEQAQYLYNDNLTLAIGKQSIYFALMVNLAIFGYVYLLVKRSSAIVQTGTAYVSILFLLVINFMLASRIAILNLYLSLLIFAFYNIIKRKKYLEGATLILGLLIGSLLLLKMFPKTINRFKELMYTDYKYNSHAVESHYNMQLTPDQWNGANIRLAVWSCGWELIKQYPVFGAQLGDKKDKLLAIYKARQFDFAYNSQRNMHNTYIDVMCTFGIVGLLLFLFGYFILPVISCVKANDMVGLTITIAFAFSLFSETYIDRSLGAVLVGFFLSFISSYRQPITENS